MSRIRGALPLALLLVLAGRSFADENCIPRGATVSAQVEALASLAVPECPTQEELQQQDAAREYKRLFGDKPVVKGTVGGRSFTGTREEIEALRATVAGKPHSRWSTSASTCSTPLCALTAIYGSEELAQRTLMFHARTGYALSVSQEENRVGGNKFVEQLWKPYEVRELEDLSRKLPRELQRLPHLEKILRVADGYRGHGHGHGVIAYTAAYMGSIISYDSISENPGYKPLELSQSSGAQHTLIHEICHNWDFGNIYKNGGSQMYSEKAGWGFRELSKWSPKPGSDSGWASAGGEKFVTSYGGDQPGEDFAESCAAFVISPEDLLQASPAKYALIKDKVFQGREFRDSWWNQSKDVSWPALGQAVSSFERSCGEMYSRCLEGHTLTPKGTVISREVTTSGSTTHTRTTEMDLRRFVASNACFIGERKSIMEKLLDQLSSDPRYCEMGGRAGIEKRSNELCASMPEKVASLQKQIDPSLVASARAACVGAGDYTAECVADGATAGIGDIDGLGPLGKRLARGMVGGASAVEMQKFFEAAPPSQWIAGCIGPLKKVMHGTSTRNGVSESFTFYSSSPSSNDLHSFPNPPDYWGGDAKGFEAACISALRSGFEKPNPNFTRKLPSASDSKSWRIALQSPVFSSEWKAFESMVLDKIGYFGSSKQDIRKILKAYVAASPATRAGMDSDEWVDRLYPINR